MNEFYPDIQPYDQGFLKVSEIHNLYYEQAGNPQGVPIVFLHGGPGSGIVPEYRRFFDPQFYRIILFDQRGAGKSTPRAELRQNTTWDLVADMELLREKLGVTQWMVFGGSWGSTLALSYAITHPSRVRALILRGIFLCRPSEIHWFYQQGASEIFPDAWESYLAPIPLSERNDLVRAYYKQLTDSDPVVQIRAAQAWSKWEAKTSRLIVDESAIATFDNINQALAFARIECHYFINNAFFKSDSDSSLSNPGFLIENIEKIRNIPGIIIQGRYDLVCPMRSAWDLHRAWPEADFVIIDDAGHSCMEPGITGALIEATNKLRNAPP